MVHALLVKTMLSYMDKKHNIASMDTEAATLMIHICLDNIHGEVMTKL